jgi:hypothetical protein
MNGLPYVSTNEVNTFANRFVRNKIIDQRYGSRAFFGIMNSSGRLEKIDGGSIIAQPILAQPNQTASSYFGADLLNADAQEEFTNVEIRWCGAYASATIIGTDERRCSGRTQILNLAKAKLESAYMGRLRRWHQQRLGVPGVQRHRPYREPVVAVASRQSGLANRALNREHDDTVYAVPDRRGTYPSHIHDEDGILVVLGAAHAARAVPR